MKKNTASILICILFLPSLAGADGILLYKPPKTGAPTTRIGGGTRGNDAEMPKVAVLAPQHTALTDQAQPTLYWYLSKPTTRTVEITLIQEGNIEPLLEKQLPSLSQAGLQSVKLADYSVAIKAGQEYRWSVAIINDSEQRSLDSVSSATIRYEPLEKPLTSIERQAEAGYWYDALQGLVESHSPLVNDLLKQANVEIPAL